MLMEIRRGRFVNLSKLLYVVILLIVVCCSFSTVLAAKNQFYRVTEICSETSKKTPPRMIEGAVLTSQGERNVNCVMTFQTDSILQRFMLRFDKLQLDCNDHLFIYDGAYTTSPHKADLSCRNTLQNVGTIFPHSNHVTLHYVTDQWGPATNGFRLLITAFKDQKNSCLHFRCKKTNFCVDTGLTCDGINHCGDRSDESPTLALCPAAPLEDILGISGVLLVVVVAAVLMLCCACALVAFVCVHRRSRARHNTPAVNYQNEYGVNMTSSYGANGTFGSTYSSSAPPNTVITPSGGGSGNRRRPAFGLGYSTQPPPRPPIGHSWRRAG